MARKTQNRSRRSGNPKLPVPHKPSRETFNAKKLLSPGKLKHLYSSMLRCRMLEEKAQVLLKDGRINRAHHIRMGSEAAEVGGMIDLQPKDCVSCGRRDVVAGFIRGTPLADVLLQVLDRSQAPGENRVLPIQARSATGLVAGQSRLAARMNISTGVALAYKMQKKPNVVVVFSGNDATALSSWRESIDFAVSHKLPIVHMVQDDLGGESVAAPATIQDPDSEIATRIPRLIVDGADAVAVYRVAQEAIRRAREGHGPALVECKTHRWVGHSEVGPAAASLSDSASLSDRVQEQRSSDPVSSMEDYLKQRGLWSAAWKERLVRSFSKEFDAAMRRAPGFTAKKSPARSRAKTNQKS